MRIAVGYWTQGEELRNVGDYAVVPMLTAMGFDVVEHNGLSPEPVFYGIGSMLSHYWLRRVFPASEKIVWGCGVQKADVPFDLRGVSVHAVRGPISARAIGRSLPIGDPGLLFSRLFAFGQGPREETIFVPHLSNLGGDLRGRTAALGATASLSPMVLGGGVLPFVKRIARDARLVLSNSLHGCIFAQSYGVPWALALAEGDELNMPTKWQDFFGSLGVPLKIVADAREGWEWWNDTRPMTPDLSGLVRAFPFDMPNKKALTALTA